MKQNLAEVFYIQHSMIDNWHTCYHCLEEILINICKHCIMYQIAKLHRMNVTKMNDMGIKIQILTDVHCILNKIL